MATTPSGRQQNNVLNIDHTSQLSGFFTGGGVNADAWGGVDERKSSSSSGTVDAGAQSSMPSLHTIVSGVILDLNSEKE